ncbi:MAG: hypothetical protein LIQ31_15715 [Planctomycetes bacterium]|nr:hypothetical protein [Planctomycetota bacterium]
MEYFVGIDGGGSKTQYLLIDAAGTILARRRGEGSSYKQTNAFFVGELLQREVAALIRNIDPAGVAGVFFAMPCYGESVQEELDKATETITRYLEPFSVAYRNDVEASWAGAFALSRQGVTILSGTGSMAIARNPAGETVRCGGWSEIFSDDGSCYWLGIETLRLFARQADGRRPPGGALYRIVRERFSLRDDFEIIDIFHNTFLGRREMVAGLQMILHDAAREGDATALALYEWAARELADMACGLRSHFPDGVTLPVSYAGGLFRSGDLILRPLRAELDRLGGFELVEPLLPPVEGAALLAVEAFAPDLVPAVRAGLLSPHKSTKEETESASPTTKSWRRRRHWKRPPPTWRNAARIYGSSFPVRTTGWFSSAAARVIAWRKAPPG